MECPSYTYVARAVPHHENGHRYYVITFPDISGICVEASKLRDVPDAAQDAPLRTPCFHAGT